MAVNFPNSPFNGEQFTANGVTYQWNSTTSLWEISLVTVPTDVSDLTDENTLLVGGGGGQGVTAYTNMSDLPMTGNSTGAMAFITSTNGLFIWNGATWYGVTVQSNTGPTISSVQDGSGGTAPFTLSTLGAATVVTVTATDPEGAPLTYSYSVTSGSLTNGGGTTATVTQNGNVFTVTPTTTEDYQGTFELTFTASDGELSDTSAASFTLQFAAPLQADTAGNTLLLTTSGSAGDNSVFTDSSANALTITPTGTPSSQSFSPYRAGGYSVRLDGSTGWIDTGVSDNFGTGDVTFECWVKTSGGGIMLAKYQGGSVMEAFQIATNNGIMASHTASGTEGTIGTKDLRDNQWHHLVFERYNGTYYYYADGELQGTVANTEDAVVGGNWIVGKHGTADIEWYDGEIRDLKLTVGTAVYGGTTPAVPTEPVSVDGTETLVLFTGIPYGKDLSPNNGTFTANGGVTFVPEGPYDVEIYDTTKHGGSIYFEGGDYVISADDPSLDVSGAYTAEAWTYVDTFPSGNIGNTGQGFVMARWTASGDQRSWGIFLGANGAIGLYHSTTGQSSYQTAIASAGTITGGTWHHIAATWDGTTMRLFVDGTVVASTADPSGPYSTPNAGVTLNSLNISLTGTGIKQYISDARYFPNQALYTADFTPPTQPQSSVGAAAHIVGTDANIYDATQTVNPVTLVGNADSSTTQTKYLSSSMYFDGIGDYVSVGTGNQFDFGTGDFTWEGWVYPTEQNRSQQIFSVGDSNTTVRGMYYRSTNKFAFYANSTLYLESASTYSTGQWYHVAVVRQGNDFTLYVDGTSVATNTQTAAIGSSAEGAYVGTNFGITPQQDWNGYIEEVRITKGLARYTEDFTVPTESLLTYTPPPAAAGASAFTFTGGDFTGTSTNAFTYSSNALNNTSGASKSDGIQNGKVYFEVGITSISNVAMGLYPSSLTDFGFTTAGGASIDSITGDIYPGPVDENATITNGSVLMFAADATAQKVWIGVNGTWTTATGDPATGSGISTSGASGETYVFAVMSGSSLGSSAEATILTSGGLNYTVPTGFTAFADAVSAASYGDRGIIMGGMNKDTSTTVNTIQYFDITSTGDAAGFGDLTAGRSGSGTVSNATLALIGGGYDNSAGTSNVDYITIATTGNAANAGNLTYARFNLGAFSNGTRGVFCGGYTTSNDNTVDYITIATSVTAADFGDSLVAIRLYGTASDNTYGIQAGGYTTTMINTIQYYTIDTADNATDFGDLTVNRYDKQGVYDLTYSAFAGGSPSTARIDYITTATPSNASDFGDLLFANRFWSGSGCSNGTRGVFCGGGDVSGVNVMQYITVSTPSNATDFGDMTAALTNPGCTSGNAA